MSLVVAHTFDPADVERLRRAYAHKKMRGARKAFPGRSDLEIQCALQAAGLLRLRRWTPEEDELLRCSVGVRSIDQVTSLLGRSLDAVYARAYDLDLLGVPQGYEYLWHACERTGYDSRQIRRILASHGVRLHRVWSREDIRGRNRHYVDPLDVDDAIREWDETETLNSAADRRGIGRGVLRTWLLEAGVEDTRRKAGHGRPWRIPTETIDRVVAERRQADEGTESLTDAAKRIGVNRQTLANWMRDTPHARKWRLSPEDVDSVAAERMARPATRARLKATRAGTT